MVCVSLHGNCVSILMFNMEFQYETLCFNIYVFMTFVLFTMFLCVFLCNK